MRIELAAGGGISEADVLAVIEDWLPAAAGADVWIGGRRLAVGDGRGRR